MSNYTSKQLLKKLATSLNEMDHTYELYAKRYNLSYTSLQIINLIAEIEDCTQKKICEVSFLPKQTVNSIIKKLNKQDIVQLTIDPNNKRSKIISFSEHGLEFSNKLIPTIKNSEIYSIEQLNKKERYNMIHSLETYCQQLKKNLLSK